MKRKLTIAGIFLALALAIVLVVISAQQPAATAAARNGFILTTNNELVIQQRDGYGVPTITAHLPQTNRGATRARPN